MFHTFLYVFFPRRKGVIALSISIILPLFPPVILEKKSGFFLNFSHILLPLYKIGLALATRLNAMTS